MEVRRLTNLARLMATVLAAFALPSTMLKVRQPADPPCSGRAAGHPCHLALRTLEPPAQATSSFMAWALPRCICFSGQRLGASPVHLPCLHARSTCTAGPFPVESSVDCAPKAPAMQQEAPEFYTVLASARVPHGS